MQRDEMRSAVTFAQSTRHGTKDRALLVVLHIAISAKNPNNRLILVTRAEPFAVGRRVGCVEERFAVLHFVVPVAAPGWQKTDEQSQRLGLVHDVVDMVPIIVVRAVLNR